MADERIGAPVVVVPHPHVAVHKEILGGLAYVRGSRVPVYRLYMLYLEKQSVAQVATRYPQLGMAKILDALSFAFDNEEVIAHDRARFEDAAEKASNIRIPRKEE